MKIDRSFVAGLGHGRDDVAIVRAIVALARALGLVTVAEGIETPAQLALLRAIGCDRGQGFLFAAPLAASDLAPMLTAPFGPRARADSDIAPGGHLSGG